MTLHFLLLRRLQDEQNANLQKKKIIIKNANSSMLSYEQFA